MQRKWLIMTAGVAISAMLSGCGMQSQGHLGNRNIRNHSVTYDANGNMVQDKRFAIDQMNEMNRVNGRRLNNNNLVGSHKNYHIEMNRKISDEVSAMPHVKHAAVLVTDSNAYVAVSLRDLHNMSRMKSRTNASYEQDGMKQDRTIGILSTGEESLTQEMKDEIAAKVRELRPSVHHVYVSANPDFVGRMNSYMEDFKLDRSIQGFVAEFNAMAERLFPASSGRNGMGVRAQGIEGQRFDSYIYD
ncbi:YhcN/YlaJ family sporulation lipoprotein [Paenibacillus sp. GCM10023252]|uniref:YhcN/YlaJ family sporulation lipoprotein n=1 Tax=Paenibacillus sp. GCM10023252 TaxID=3252649 RepID=UPI0036165853